MNEEIVINSSSCCFMEYINYLIDFSIEEFMTKRFMHYFNLAKEKIENFDSL